MLNRLATLAAICMLVPIGAAPSAGAEPGDGLVASGPPVSTTSLDGWTLTVAAKDETQFSVPPLTTSLASREYLVGGTFTGSIAGSGGAKLTGGELEVGYQIGCGIDVSKIRVIGQAGITPGFGAAGLASVAFPILGGVEVALNPGKVTAFAVTTKKFKSTAPRVTVGDYHVKLDGCVGQSYVRSYAILKSSTEKNDAIVTYEGVTKVV